MNRSSSSASSPRWSLGLAHVVFVVSFTVRLVALCRLTASPFLLPSRGDMYFYNDWAQRILHGQFTDHHAFYGLPLYAYLLAFLYRLFGYTPFVPGLLQALLEAGTATLIYKIANCVFAAENRAPGLGSGPIGSRIIGGVAAVAWAFFVPAQAYSVILMPTAWLIFIFWFLVWQVVRTETAPSLVQSLLFGLLIGVTAMGIATILFIVPLLVAAIIARPASLKADSFLRGVQGKMAATAFLFLGLGAGTSPCWLHNYFIAHDHVTLSAHSGINFWIGNNPIANGYPRFPPGLRAGQAAMLQDSITVAEAEAGRPLKRSEVSVYWSAKASNFIRENPGAWLKLVGRKIANFWSAFQYDDLSIVTSLREQGVIWPGPRFGLVAALALPGMLLASAAHRRARWIIAAIFLHMASLLSVFVTERYRLAAVPGLLLFAAFGLWALWTNCSLGNFRRVALYLITLVAATAFVSASQKNPSLWALDAYNSGLQALESENLDLAQSKLELAHAYVPDNAEINVALGNLWFERKDLQKAESFYRAVIGLEPRHKGALTNLGVVALEERRWDDAIGLLQYAIETAPNDAKSHYLLARAFLGADRLEAANIEIDRTLELNSNQPEFSALQEEIRRRVQQPR